MTKTWINEIINVVEGKTKIRSIYIMFLCRYESACVYKEREKDLS
jgi:hypothetical protein